MKNVWTFLPKWQSLGVGRRKNMMEKHKTMSDMDNSWLFTGSFSSMRGHQTKLVEARFKKEACNSWYGSSYVLREVACMYCRQKWFACIEVDIGQLFGRMIYCELSNRKIVTGLGKSLRLKTAEAWKSNRRKYRHLLLCSYSSVWLFVAIFTVWILGLLLSV